MHKIKLFFKGYKSLLVLILLMMFFRTAYADWSHVPTSSMEPTILPGDVLWINKTSFGPSLPFFNKRLFTWKHPERGDIITFIPPHEDILHVKRVIGVPGDTLHIEGNAIYINGLRMEQSVTESSEDILLGIEDLLGSPHAFKVNRNRSIPYFGRTLVVPEGKLFVMGDFRNNSVDSRAWGFVDENRVTGKVSTVAVSFSRQRNGFLARVAIPIQ
ncbi:signal peptidase I [Aliidiomarina minuta]|uniref:Signal peptidase I n=1 Tax=Aliidiomarina minuta TaxID=880057 RepID=A0A432W926_9GAMM|nr:signal peptidase I [Aliidiomarina minuta]RUO26561.1 signal peptidase I [Aliidiomarina minuta]